MVSRGPVTASHECACATVALSLAVGSSMVSYEVTVEQNPKNAKFWKNDRSTFTVTFLGAYDKS